MCVSTVAFPKGFHCGIWCFKALSWGRPCGMYSFQMRGLQFAKLASSRRRLLTILIVSRSLTTAMATPTLPACCGSAKHLSTSGAKPIKSFSSRARNRSTFSTNGGRLEVHSSC